MRAFASCLIATAALLPATIPACATPPSTPRGTSWVVPHFTFEPMSAEKQMELRHALANCAKVEMVIQWVPVDKLYRTCSDKRWRPVQSTETVGSYKFTHTEWVRTLSPGAELNAILTRLAAVEQWYTPVFDKSYRYQPSAALGLRILDVNGRELFHEERAHGPWFSCRDEHGERVPFPAFFPDFPARNCFGK